MADSSLGTYYVVMQRTFYAPPDEDEDEDAPLRSTDGGSPCRIFDTDEALARQDAWERTLQWLSEPKFLEDYDVFQDLDVKSVSLRQALETLSPEDRQAGPWGSVVAWKRGHWEMPLEAPAEFYEALRPLLEHRFFYVEEVPIHA